MTSQLPFSAPERGLKAAATAALNAAGVTAPGQIGFGWPFGTNLAQLLQQRGENWQGTVYPYGRGRDVSRYRPEWAPSTPPPAATFQPVIAGNELSFSGTPMSGANVLVFFDSIAASVWFEPALYQTQSGDTFATYYAALAVAINALGVAGINAVATSSRLTVNGAPALKVNIGTTGTASMEVARRNQDFQLSFWAPDPYTRNTLFEAVQPRIASTVSRFIALPDGTQMGPNSLANYWLEESAQSSYSLYEAHLIYNCEYAVVLTTPATQVEAPSVSESINGGAAVVGYTG